MREKIKRDFGKKKPSENIQFLMQNPWNCKPQITRLYCADDVITNERKKNNFFFLDLKLEI